MCHISFESQYCIYNKYNCFRQIFECEYADPYVNDKRMQHLCHVFPCNFIKHVQIIENGTSLLNVDAPS